jgi:hypothetical protein
VGEGITDEDLVVYESSAQSGGLVALLFLPAGGFPRPNARNPLGLRGLTAARCDSGPLPMASLPSITILPVIAIVQFAQRS